MTPNSSPTPHVRDRLAQVVAAMRYDTLPQEVIHQAKRLIIDTLACAYGAVDSKPVAIISAVARQLGGTPEATILATGERTSAPLACWVNGTMIRYLNANDYYFGRDGSHGSGNLAAALAICERMGLSGRDLILALVIAYEVQLRFCDHAGEPRIWDRGWHNGTNMQFSSAALTARMLGLGAEGIANAIAISASHNNMLAQLQRGRIPMMKATAEATVAKAGIEAALLAQAGLTGPEEVFEGKVGWVKAVAGGADFDALTAPIVRHRILDTCTKPYAAEAMTQAAIQAAIDLMATHRLALDEIEAVEACFHEYAFKKPSWDPAKLYPKDRETADHSFPYMIAVALMEGDCSEHQFREELLFSPATRALMDKITLATDPELTALWPKSSGSIIRVRTRAGTVLEQKCLYPPGHPNNRESDADLERKFMRLTTGVLPEARAGALLEAIWSLDQMDDLVSFGRLLSRS